VVFWEATNTHQGGRVFDADGCDDGGNGNGATDQVGRRAEW
jgi:hypothetical protein